MYQKIKVMNTKNSGIENKIDVSVNSKEKSALQFTTIAKELAMVLVGDGDKENNLWFVTYGPYISLHNEGEEPNFELLPGFSEENDCVTYGPFVSYEYACKKYDSIDLDPYTGVGLVFIEDRACGQVKEKFLEKVVTVDYSFNEIHH